jgi:hypothetical protein
MGEFHEYLISARLRHWLCDYISGPVATQTVAPERRPVGGLNATAAAPDDTLNGCAPVSASRIAHLRRRRLPPYPF